MEKFEDLKPPFFNQLHQRVLEIQQVAQERMFTVDTLISPEVPVEIEKTRIYGTDIISIALYK